MIGTRAPSTPEGVGSKIYAEELRLNPLLHGRSRVPGRSTPPFDLEAFGHALRDRDFSDQLACYALEADIRLVGAESRAPRLRTVRGTRAVVAWLVAFAERQLEVTDLVDGGDRIAFSQRWRDDDNVELLATSTAELRHDLISTQRTVLSWVRPVEGHLASDGSAAAVLVRPPA